jgi:tRNA nucleotidyltransferase (CCA-adding enzyme)
MEDRDYPQATLMRQVYAAAADVQARILVEQGLSGLALAEALRRERLAAITEVRRNFNRVVTPTAVEVQEQQEE